jgi:phosphohistidine phosphatase
MKMNLYLVQHAEAKREEEDPQRPLSEKGWSDIRKVAAYISKHTNVNAGSIVHSPKTRTRQTAEALAEYLNPPEGAIEVEGLKPLDDPSIWAENLAETKEDIVLVGHLPYLSKLSSQLLCQNQNKTILDFQRGGIVCMERDESGIWAVCWMVIPKIL